jgi:hypothetical protein
MHRSRTFKFVLLFVVFIGSSFLAAPVAWADDDLIADTGEPTDPERARGFVDRFLEDRDGFKDVSIRSLWQYLRTLRLISPWRADS